MAREDFRFFHTLRVRWAEVDPQGIVFNAHYLMYCDVAVTEYWRAIGYPYPEGLLALGVDSFVVKAVLEYQQPARFDDLVDVCLRTARLGRTSMRAAFELYRQDARLVSAELTYVLADPTTRQPTPIPEALRVRIAEYERVPPLLPSADLG